MVVEPIADTPTPQPIQIYVEDNLQDVSNMKAAALTDIDLLTLSYCIIFVVIYL